MKAVSSRPARGAWGSAERAVACRSKSVRSHGATPLGRRQGPAYAVAGPADHHAAALPDVDYTAAIRRPLPAGAFKDDLQALVSRSSREGANDRAVARDRQLRLCCRIVTSPTATSNVINASKGPEVPTLRRVSFTATFSRNNRGIISECTLLRSFHAEASQWPKRTFGHS